MSGKVKRGRISRGSRFVTGHNIYIIFGDVEFSRSTEGIKYKA